MNRLAQIAFVLSIVGVDSVASQNKMSDSPNLTIKHMTADHSIERLDDAVWKSASQVSITKYWSSKSAPQGRAFKVRLFWSDTALYIRFDASQGEPLVVSKIPDVSIKTIGLWDRDVCEIFIAPDKSDRNKYLEFEVAPTGEWVDLAIEVAPQGRITDTKYHSGVNVAARIGSDSVVMAMKIPWDAFGSRPNVGDVWLGNIFRCVGKDPTRGYLAWQPTRTRVPNFHVPEVFGEFHFVD